MFNELYFYTPLLRILYDFIPLFASMTNDFIIDYIVVYCITLYYTEYNKIHYNTLYYNVFYHLIKN
jgi:hypothetical protein